MSHQPMPSELEGKVFVLLEPDEARTLARVLAHYEALTHPVDAPPVEAADGYDAEVWNQVLLRLLQQAEAAEADRGLRFEFAATAAACGECPQ